MENIIRWWFFKGKIGTEYQELKEFLPFSFNSTPIINDNNLTICITGKLSSFKTKAEATEILTKLGFKVVESVTKTLTYLVDEQNNDSSKRKKADSYNIPIINNLNNFLEEIK